MRLSDGEDFYNTKPECDRRTDRQTDKYLATAYIALSIAFRVG